MNENNIIVKDGFGDLLRRHIAFWVDLIVVAATVYVLSLLIGAQDDTVGWMMFIGYIVYIVATVRLYDATVGMRLFGWRMTTASNTKPSIGSLLLRCVILGFTFTGFGAFIGLVYGLSTGNCFWWDGVAKLKIVGKITI